MRGWISPGSTISWDVKEAPTFDLTNVSEFRQQVVDHLRLHKFKAPGGLDHGDVADIFQQSAEPSSFNLTLPKVELSIGDGSPIEAAFVVPCTINTAGGDLTLQALKATFSTDAPPWDKLVIEGILNTIITIANHLLCGVDIPQISFEGISLTAPAVSVQESRIVVFFNLDGKPQPDIVTLPWPANPFFVYLSDDVKNAIVHAKTKGASKTMSKKGSVGSHVGGAGYHAEATVSDVRVSSSGRGTPEYNLASNVSGGVSAKVKVACVPIGVHYKLYAKPNPTCTLHIGLKGTSLSATTGSVNSFVIVLEPSGNVMEKILSAITDPILQAVSGAFSPLISHFLDGITFHLCTLPNIPISVHGHTITLSPSDMSLTSSNGYLAAVGNLKVS